MDAKKLLEQVRQAHDKLQGSVVSNNRPGKIGPGNARTVKVDRGEFNQAMAHLGGLVTALEVLAG